MFDITFIKFLEFQYREKPISGREYYLSLYGLKCLQLYCIKLCIFNELEPDEETILGFETSWYCEIYFLTYMFWSSRFWHRCSALNIYLYCYLQTRHWCIRASFRVTNSTSHAVYMLSKLYGVHLSPCLLIGPKKPFLLPCRPISPSSRLVCLVLSTVLTVLLSQTCKNESKFQ